jgi:hypothetical protein
MNDIENEDGLLSKTISGNRTVQYSFGDKDRLVAIAEVIPGVILIHLHSST